MKKILSAFIVFLLGIGPAQAQFPIINEKPVANAGHDFGWKSINGRVMVHPSGIGSFDPDGTVVVYKWEEDGHVLYEGPNSSPFVTLFGFGLHTLTLTVQDDDGAWSDPDTVQVNLIQLFPPVVNAGPDQVLTLPVNETLLKVTVEDATSEPFLPTWTQVAGPPSMSIHSPNAVSTTVQFSETGTYTIRVTVLNGFFSVTDEVQVVVRPEEPVKEDPNLAPVVNAGKDAILDQPSSYVLRGTVADDGLPHGTLNMEWTLISGPSLPEPFQFQNKTSSTTQVKFTVPGVYTFRLSANDGEITAFDDVEIDVRSPEKPRDPETPPNPQEPDVDIREPVIVDDFVNIVNPTQGKIEVPLRLREAAAICIEVYDQYGDWVRSLCDRDFSEGRHIVDWDGKNHLSQIAAPGVYVLLIRINGQKVMTRKIILS